MFDYNDAFSRNIGWVTEQEQQILRSKTVAIAGAGGVGFEHAVTLARLGIENFHISDFDDFEIHNMNRQAGCFTSTFDQPKCSVLERTLKDINPNVTTRNFDSGVNETNVEAFFEGVDIYIDSLDFFALSARLLVFNYCEEHQIPAITTAPLGMGVSYLCFKPGSMTFEEYFRFSDKKTDTDKFIQFLIGLSPAMVQQKYMADKTRADFNAQKGPSTCMAVKLCAGVAASNALKLLLERGDVICAPHGFHFDAYLNKLTKTRLRFGNRGLIQRIKFLIAGMILKKK